MKHLINVSCQLPETKTGFDNLSNGFSSSTNSVKKDFDTWWIGWNGEPAPAYKDRDSITKDLKLQHQHIPIFLEEDDINNFYNGFSNSSIWPIMHYISSQIQYNEDWWEKYCLVNRLFADTVVQHVRDDDIIWIHDYHLMLLPSYLREADCKVSIGFFLHRPFPSYELFRCHPRREELLNGVLGSDLIGFQTFGYLRHFRSTVLRVLGLESEMALISHECYTTKMGVYPVGINIGHLKKVKESKEFAQQVKEYKKGFSGKKIVLSVDRLDYSKGIPRKLSSIEAFLENNPDERDNVVFVILVTPSMKEKAEFENLTHYVEHSVGHINGQYSTISNTPIVFMNKYLPHNQLCALYAVSDILLATPLVDGMNITSKEYLAIKGKEPGVLILSEFAGASQELFNAIMVNPYNINQVSGAIKQALSMTKEEVGDTALPMLSRITSNDAENWAISFISDLEQFVRSSADTVKPVDSSIIELFKQSDTKKALFLDYDGSLREFVDIPSQAVPSPELISILDKFNERDDLDIYIVSGRNTEFLQKHFGHYNFTLIGEHGYFYREPGEDWKTLIGEIDLTWKKELIEIFNLYSRSTPGSNVEEKTSSIVWHYRRSDPEFGSWKARELIGDLTEAISNLPVEIHHGKKIVEVSSQHVNKGIAVARFRNNRSYETVLCAGDDKTDETMFHFEDESIITIKIGQAETDANYRVSTTSRFRKLLSSFNN